MAAKVDILARKLLTAMRRELAALGKVDLFALPQDRFHAGRIRCAVMAAREGVVEVDLVAWIGRGISDAERKRCWRAIDRLVETGAVERVHNGYDSVRATHLRVKARGSNYNLPTVPVSVSASTPSTEDPT